MLAKKPDLIKISDILLVTEGNLAPVTCLEDGAMLCSMVAECSTLDMWKRFYKTVMDFLNGITVADLIRKGTPDFDYII